jgi:hypothetical protein
MRAQVPQNAAKNEQYFYLVHLKIFVEIPLKIQTAVQVLKTLCQLLPIPLAGVDQKSILYFAGIQHFQNAFQIGAVAV